MTITSRTYTDEDLPRLQNALASWIHEAGDCGYCHIGELVYRIYANIQGLPVNDLVQVWEDDTGIMGFALNLRFENAFEVYASPKYRGTDDEITMIQSAEAQTRLFMQQVGREEKNVIMDVWDCDVTRKKVLQQLGYEQYKVWGYYEERSLADSIPEPVLPEGFTIRGATMSDYAQVANIHNKAFGISYGAWGAEEYRDAVMVKPGYDPQREMVVVAPDGQFVAFTIMWLDTVNKVGLFEPVGTHRDSHRKGLGKALMLHVLHQMKAHGMETAMVGHDAENVAATALYHSIGFSEKHTSLGFTSK
jgi:mycothiol synthase